MKMNLFSRTVFMLGAVGMFMAVPVLNAQPSPASNVMDSIAHAKEAVEHGKQGHADAVAMHAEKARNFAERGGKSPHLAEGMTHLTAAMEHGKAGHADVATQHVEEALTHLNAAK